MHIRKNRSFFRKDKKDSLKSNKESVNKEKVTSGCSNSYGYLAVRPKNSPIPQECLCCLKVIDCLYKNKK